MRKVNRQYTIMSRGTTFPVFGLDENETEA